MSFLLNGHNETAQGALAVLPTSNTVLTIIMDPYEIISGGVSAFRLTDGSVSSEYSIFDNEASSNTNGTFGKAAGLGDLELICNLLPIQIGNYVWIDTDQDGVQDACEDPVEGLTVKLYTKPQSGNAELVATTMTDAAGEYYFTNPNDPDETWETGFTEIVRGDSYFIVFMGDSYDDTTDEITVGSTPYTLTALDSGEGNNPEFNDSDASEMTVPGLGDMPVIMFTAERTDHTFDVGLIEQLAPCELSIANVTTDCQNGTDFTVSFDVNWDYANAASDMIEITVDGDAQAPFTPSGTTGTQSYGPFNLTGPAYDIVLEANFISNTTCAAATVIDLIACTDLCVDGLGGNVFNDFDNDGTDDGDNETGQENVKVEVYDCDGMLVCETWTNVDGNWTCTGLNDAEEYRVEFSTPLQPYLQSSFAGMDNGTNTQFVTAPSCEVDYGVVAPIDYCQENPFMAVPCYDVGAATGNDPALVRFSYNFTGGTTSLATFGQIGATWGTSYQRSSNTVFNTAFLKRNCRIGAKLRPCIPK